MWSESIIHAFGNGSDGYNPTEPLVVDNNGNLFSTTKKGGGFMKSGVVYEIVP
jgi:hypothetical protein